MIILDGDYFLTDVIIEKKWQRKWRNKHLFQSNPDAREKLFLTVAFPYPSGAMHIPTQSQMYTLDLNECKVITSYSLWLGTLLELP